MAKSKKIEVVTDDSKKVVRCSNPKCKMNQFFTTTGLCRKCHRPLSGNDQPAPEGICDTENVCLHIGEELRRVRVEKGWSQTKLANKMATPRSYVSKIENGSAVPTFPTLISFVMALGIPSLTAFISSIEFREGLIDEHPF
jgi:ribosome-binding protein aMBF1 (putative translation factor)